MSTLSVIVQRCNATVFYANAHTRWRAASYRLGAGRRVGPRRVTAWMTWACEHGQQWRGTAGFG
eukprot:1796426-Prymnesium_polylepis.1